jgi:hypothetical protein
MGQEIKSGVILRNLVSKVPSKTVDMIFKLVTNEPEIKEKIEQMFCFDYHKNFIDLGMELILGRNTIRHFKIKQLS